MAGRYDNITDAWQWLNIPALLNDDLEFACPDAGERLVMAIAEADGLVELRDGPAICHPLQARALIARLQAAGLGEDE